MQAGQTVLNGKYHILMLIGEGGTTSVWLADEPRFAGRQAANKEPRADLLPELDQEVRLESTAWHRRRSGSGKAVDAERPRGHSHAGAWERVESCHEHDHDKCNA